MTECNYPICHATDLNDYGMCSEHDPKYSYHKGNAGTKNYNHEFIKEGFKRLASNAPKHIAPSNVSVKPADLKAVQNELL